MKIIVFLLDKNFLVDILNRFQKIHLIRRDLFFTSQFYNTYFTQTILYFIVSSKIVLTFSFHLNAGKLGVYRIKLAVG